MAKTTTKTKTTQPWTTKAYDKRREKLDRRIRILTALTPVTRREITSRMGDGAGVDPSYLTHLLSGSRNQTLDLYIDEIERIVGELEKEHGQ